MQSKRSNPELYGLLSLQSWFSTGEPLSSKAKHGRELTAKIAGAELGREGVSPRGEVAYNELACSLSPNHINSAFTIWFELCMNFACAVDYLNNPPFDCHSRQILLLLTSPVLMVPPQDRKSVV